MSPLIENLLKVEATDHRKIQVENRDVSEFVLNQTKSRTPHQKHIKEERKKKILEFLEKEGRITNIKIIKT